MGNMLFPMVSMVFPVGSPVTSDAFNGMSYDLHISYFRCFLCYVLWGLAFLSIYSVCQRFPMLLCPVLWYLLWDLCHLLGFFDAIALVYITY